MEDRRSFFTRMLAALAALGLSGSAAAAPAAGGKQRVAYHLSELEKVEDALDRLELDGVGLHACGNTMRAQKVDLAALLRGFVRRDEGGVVVLATLQQQEYVYLRP